MHTQCSYCARHIGVKDHRFHIHSPTPRAPHRCPLSGQYIPVTGHTPLDHEKRARAVLDLATQIQDENPAIVWTYLTATPAAELQRLLVIALAAIPITAPIEQIFGWVYQLPAASQPEDISA